MNRDFKIALANHLALTKVAALEVAQAGRTKQAAPGILDTLQSAGGQALDWAQANPWIAAPAAGALVGAGLQGVTGLSKKRRRDRNTLSRMLTGALTGAGLAGGGLLAYQSLSPGKWDGLVEGAKTLKDKAVETFSPSKAPAAGKPAAKSPAKAVTLDAKDVETLGQAQDPWSYLTPGTGAASGAITSGALAGTRGLLAGTDKVLKVIAPGNVSPSVADFAKGWGKLTTEQRLSLFNNDAQLVKALDTAVQNSKANPKPLLSILSKARMAPVVTTTSTGASPLAASLGKPAPRTIALIAGGNTRTADIVPSAFATVSNNAGRPRVLGRLLDMLRGNNSPAMTASEEAFSKSLSSPSPALGQSVKGWFRGLPSKPGDLLRPKTFKGNLALYGAAPAIGYFGDLTANRIALRRELAQRERLQAIADSIKAP